MIFKAPSLRGVFAEGVDDEAIRQLVTRGGLLRNPALRLYSSQ